jgi:hypothetical protein
MCSWSSKVPDTTPFGCVSGSVPQRAVEMESKKCFDFWIQKQVDVLDSEGIMECPKYDAALNNSTPQKPFFLNGSNYLDIDSWIVQNYRRADWYGGLMHSAFAQEIKALIDHLAFIYGASLIE